MNHGHPVTPAGPPPGRRLRNLTIMGVVTALSFLRWLLVALLLCTPPADAPVWRAAYGTMGVGCLRAW